VEASPTLPGASFCVHRLPQQGNLQFRGSLGQHIRRLSINMATPIRKSFAGFVAAFLATTCLGFAAGGPHKSPKRATAVTFPQTMKFNDGNTLPAGSYRMEVSEDSQTPSVSFSQDGKVLETLQAKEAPQEGKNSETEIDSVAEGNAQLLTVIHMAGWDKELIFGTAGKGGAATSTQ
jgi:hypothetical protein